VLRHQLTFAFRALSCREQIGAPGMVVLQFAWGGGTNNVHLPHMHYENSFCYPGTHDNETAVGWFAGSANAQVGAARRTVCYFLGACLHAVVNSHAVAARGV
jgi:hypothetical protein